MSTLQEFDCPKCGGPLNYQGGTGPVIHCPYCQTAVIVPEALRRGAGQFASPYFKPSGDPGDFPQVVDLLRAGKKMAAIKLYKDTTGAGLKDSKEAVEEIEARLRAN